MSMIPGDEPHESLNLSDAIRAADPEKEFSDLTESPAPKLPDEPKWEAPEWTKRWKPEARDALGRFASNPELKAFYDPLKSQLEETNAYISNRDKEYAEYRKRLDPLYSVVQPYEQRYALQGIPVHQGIAQLFQAAELLNTNPDQAFPWLAGTYRPRNPQEALMRLAQSWGVDLNAAVADQPYIDPTVTALLTPLQQQVQQMQQMLASQQQQAVSQQHHALVSEISDFEAAKDDNGQLLHPHFAAVFDDMVQLVQLGHAKDLPTAYQLATRYNPTLAQSAQANAAEQARKKAIEQASARTAAAEQSEKASRTVKGKGQAGAQQRMHLSLQEGIAKAAAELGDS